MKNGIPCNEYRFTSKAMKNQIVFRFVTNDSITPSSYTVKIGDIDPMTGKPITDPEIFMEYYRLADHQIYVQNKESNDLLYLDGILNDEGETKSEKQFSAPEVNPFEDVPEMILRLREVAASLSGRQADIYKALLMKYSGGKEKITMSDLAKKWGVSVTRLCQERDRIIKMIRKRLQDQDPEG